MIKKFEGYIGGKSVAMYHGLGGGGDKDMPKLLRMNGFNKIHYPLINYEREWYRNKGKTMFLRELKAIENVDLIMGLSLGGYTAFELAGYTGKDLILVNPAIDRSKTLLPIKSFDVPFKRNFGNVEVYLGTLDDLIDKQWTIDYLAKLNVKASIYLVNGMEHSPYLEEFDQILGNSKFTKWDDKEI